MKAILLLAMALALAGCEPTPVVTVETSNPHFTVTELFTYKGVTINRFTDASQYVYFTTPASSVMSTRTEYCGKGCTRSVMTQMLSPEDTAPNTDAQQDAGTP